MADNPIKHNDLIQPGNPFGDAIKGLEKLLKLFKQLDKEVKTTAKEYIKYVEKQNTATKEGRKNVENAAKATTFAEEVGVNGKSFRFGYEYDYGDLWEHQVLFDPEEFDATTATEGIWSGLPDWRSMR